MGTALPGWTCTICGVFVQQGTTHVHGFSTHPPAIARVLATLDDADVDRIAHRVVELLVETRMTP